MSLRGRTTPDAISYLFNNKEIAALPAGARNDNKDNCDTASLGNGIEKSQKNPREDFCPCPPGD